MKFTDEDLSMLEDVVSHNVHLKISVSANTLEALLHRLECAENKAQLANWIMDDFARADRKGYDPRISEEMFAHAIDMDERWRKASGKEK